MPFPRRASLRLQEISKLYRDANVRRPGIYDSAFLTEDEKRDPNSQAFKGKGLVGQGCVP